MSEKIGHGERGRGYSKNKKIAVLHVLSENSGNVAKASEETGVSRQAIKAWKRELYDEYKTMAGAALKEHFEVDLIELFGQTIAQLRKKLATASPMVLTIFLNNLHRMILLSGGKPTERTEHTIRGIEDLVMDIRRKRGLDAPVPQPPKLPANDQPN